MDERRAELRERYLGLARDLAGKVWTDPTDAKHPFTNKTGAILCPLAQFFGNEELVGVELHEIEVWPWSSMSDKYLKRKVDPDRSEYLQRVAAYYQLPGVVMVSHEYHELGNTVNGRVICRWHSRSIWGDERHDRYYDGLNGLLRVKLYPRWDLIIQDAR